MISFLVSIVVLIVGYFVYGKFVEKVFGIEPQKQTPAHELNDGVDYVVMPKWKAFLIQFLNIAGTGPIFGAIAGAMWGPAAFLWIVFGCIFAGAVHDYLIGMMSVRSKGKSVSELVGNNLGNKARQFMRVFSIILLVLVGAVFIVSSADILKASTGVDRNLLIFIIICYYILSTMLPIDKIVGRIYPVFGLALLIMVIGIFFGIVSGGYLIPEVSLQNVHPAGKSIFPYLCISIACGAISGFHATQAPIMARCISNEKDGRPVFFGAMITEGVVALVWAAAAMSFFGGVVELGEVVGQPAVVVNTMSRELMGPVGGVLALLGVAAAPISSGDGAFRSARLNLSDIFKIKQGPIKNRFMLAFPLFAVGIGLTFVDFQIIWRYFAWANQTLATVALWAAVVYLCKRGYNYWIALVPAMFMSVVVTSYILIAPEGLVALLPFKDTATIELVGDSIGVLVSVICTALFFKNKNMIQSTIQKETIPQLSMTEQNIEDIEEQIIPE